MITGGWIGVDLDGTLAHYGSWIGPTHIGAPIPKMVERVKKWITEGVEVRIFTARVSTPHDDERLAIIQAIQAWLVENGIPPLEVTCIKDFAMVRLYDDRCVQVEMNTGILIGSTD